MSNTISQKDAVVRAVENVLGGNFTANETKVREILTKDQLTAIRDQVFSSLQNGEVVLKTKFDDEKALRRYVNGMVDNHLRKAKTLNGNEKYAPAATLGPRGDEQLKTMRSLLKTYNEDSENFTAVSEAIGKRQAELKAEKAAITATAMAKSAIANIDTSVIEDEDLKALISS